jgi:hypothetical protein
MFRTSAAKLRTAGAAAAILATGVTLYGVAGSAKADTTYSDAYCYKNPAGGENATRVFVSNVRVNGPQSSGNYTVLFTVDLQNWSAESNSYVSAGIPGSTGLGPYSETEADSLASNPCPGLTGDSSYKYRG